MPFHQTAFKPTNQLKSIPYNKMPDVTGFSLELLKSPILLSTMTSSLRRRLLAKEMPSDLREDTHNKADEVRLAPVSKISRSQPAEKGRKRRNGLIFFLGGLVGVIAAGLFAKSNDLIEFPEFGMMESLLDVIPATVVQDARELIVCLLLS